VVLVQGPMIFHQERLIQVVHYHREALIKEVVVHYHREALIKEVVVHYHLELVVPQKQEEERQFQPSCCLGE
jgi:hypothetical protein